MTFQQWREASGSKWAVRPYGVGGFQVFSDDLTVPEKVALFHLADYVVSSSVSGPSYIMVPRA